MSNQRKVLGILGGLGPMASVYFYEMLTAHTKVTRDQEHLDIILNSRASTPDRTAFILGKSEDDPGEVLARDAKMLEEAGAGAIAMPCNTAHRFYDRIEESINVPFVNMIKETVCYCASKGAKKIGIMATDGTVLAKSYDGWCEKYGIETVVPEPASQAKVMSIIYDNIKKGIPADMCAFYAVADELRSKGCEKILLACTELSLIKRAGGLDAKLFVDPMEILTLKCIKECGGTPCGFEELDYE